MQGDVLVACYVADVASKLQIHSLASGSKQREVKLPGIGSVTQFAGKREDSEFFFGFSSFTEPGATYRCVCVCDHQHTVIKKKHLMLAP